MNIVKYIIEILKENEKVAVPGLGIFTLEYKSTTIHPVEHTFTPPSKNISFTAMAIDDDLLVRNISEKEQISLEAAIIYVKTFSEALISDINKGKLAGIEGLGVFSLSESDEIVFAPESNIFSDDEFGLSGFTSPAIVRSEYKDKAAFIAQKEKDEKNKEIKKKKQYLLIAAFVIVITAIIFLVLFTDIFRNYIYNNNLNSGTKTEQPIVNEIPTPVQNTETDTSESENDTLSATTNNSASDETKDAVSNASGTENSQANTYYLVAGSFKSEENAGKSVAALKAKGYTNAGIVRQYNDNGMYIVYYESHNNKEEATNALQQIIKNENHESWLLKK